MVRFELTHEKLAKYTVKGAHPEFFVWPGVGVGVANPEAVCNLGFILNILL